MIAIIRVRLNMAPNAAVWSDQQFQALMDPAIPFSLAHYWQKCAFGLADLSYRLLPPVTVVDPQPSMTAEQIKADPQYRSTRVRAITKTVDDQYKPDWNAFSTLMIWVASPLDLWGSSAFDHGSGRCAVLMCDVASKFDQICHELGHTLGFDHPFGREGIEYNSAYDIMGGYASEWTRPAVPALPVGTSASGSDPMVLAGPMISAAQLSTSTYKPSLAALFIDLPPNVKTSPLSVKLIALDAAADRWPQVAGPVAAVLPPDPVSPDDHYVLELRRAQGYDAGLRSPALPSNPPVGIVVHGYNVKTKRFTFAGVLPLTNNLGDQDLHLFSGMPGSDITIRLLEVGPGDEWARVRVGGPNYWRNFGVDVTIEDIADEPHYTAWEQVEVQPCVFAATGLHSVRYRTASHTFRVDATSYGYEAPYYTWKLNDAALDPDLNAIALHIQTSRPDPLLGWQNRELDVVLPYSIAGATMTLGTPAGDLVALGKFTLTIGVTANETSPGVLKNLYPERSVTTTVRFDTVKMEWDQAYSDKLDYCEHIIDEVDRKRVPVPLPQLPGGRPDDGLPNILDVLGSIVDRNPAAANVLIEEISRSANIPRLAVIARLQGHR